MRISPIPPMSTKIPISSKTQKSNSPAFKSLVFQQDSYCTDEDYKAAKNKIEEIARSKNAPKSDEERLLRLSSITSEDKPNDYPVEVIVKDKNNVNIILPFFEQLFFYTFPLGTIFYPDCDIIPDYQKKIDWSCVLQRVDPFNFEESIDEFIKQTGWPVARRSLSDLARECIDQHKINFYIKRS